MIVWPHRKLRILTMYTMLTVFFILFSALANAQETREVEILNLYSELSRCATYSFEDAQSKNTQAVFVEAAKKELVIIMVVEWPDGEQWTTETRVQLADIEPQSIALVMPNTGIASTVEEVLQYGGIEFKTEYPRVRIIENRNGVTTETETWSGFIRIDDDDARQCVFVALLAIIAQVNSITN